MSANNYRPEVGHWVMLSRNSETAYKVKYVDDGYVFGVAEIGNPLSWRHIVCPDTHRVVPNGDGTFKVYKTHPIDDRLPEGFTPDVVRWLHQPNRWINCYPKAKTVRWASKDASAAAASGRFALINSDGTVTICDGKQTFDTVQVPE